MPLAYFLVYLSNKIVRVQTKDMSKLGWSCDTYQNTYALALPKAVCIIHWSISVMLNKYIRQY